MREVLAKITADNRSHYAGGVLEWTFNLANGSDAYYAMIICPNGAEQMVPLFYKGKMKWGLRYTAYRTGKYLLTVQACGIKNEPFFIIPYPGDNPLLKNGNLVVKDKHFFYENGKPFFYLADSWWFGMCSRLAYTGFKKLVDDRSQKGFSAIQFAIGFACDIMPFDERDKNEGGFIWDEALSDINPEYFDYTDRRILYMVEKGIRPCIVGAWGYYIHTLGVERAKRHWRNLIARYGAFPVNWILCGESRLCYPNIYMQSQNGESYPMFIRRQTAMWSEVLDYVKRSDPFERLITVHPGPIVTDNEKKTDILPLDNLDKLDYILIQPGHGGTESVFMADQHYQYYKKLFPDKPILIGECAWEGMHASNPPKVQRNLIWSSILLGMPGYSYGTDALWQMNAKGAPFGKSVLGHIWGNAPWQEAYKWEGSTNMAAARRILEKYDWWKIEPIENGLALDYIKNANKAKNAGLAAKIGDNDSIIYFPDCLAPWSVNQKLRSLIPNGKYTAVYHDPRNADAYEMGIVMADQNGEADPPFAPILQDWVLVLQYIKSAVNQ